MNTRADLRRYEEDRVTGETLLTFAVSGVPEEEILPLMGGIVLELTAKRAAKVKTRNQLAYCWKLMNLLAVKHHTTAEEIYGKFLNEDPQIWEDEDGQPDIKLMRLGTIPKVVNHVHWLYLGTFDIRNPDPEIKTVIKKDAYARMIGISGFDRERFSHFIDNVVFECKNAGIETLPPEEVERLKSEWKV